MYKTLKEFEEIAEKIYHLLGWYGGSSFKVEYFDYRAVCLFFDGPSDEIKLTEEYKKEIIKFVQKNIPDVIGVKFYPHDSGRVISDPFVGIFLRTKKSENKGLSYFWENIGNRLKRKCLH